MKLSRLLLVVFTLASLQLVNAAQAADKLRVDVVPGAYSDSVTVAAKEAKSQPTSLPENPGSHPGNNAQYHRPSPRWAPPRS
ncbi:hypothetical protein [Herbaspirillum sp. B65]|uniref:hypothetical protein n=1 Tax=Herbaspirillum sp. B65 TaxID=137708 RepID=UPI0020916B0B